MVSKDSSVKLGIGFSPVPFGFAKASSDGGIDTKSLCDCGGRCGYLSDEDGNKVECQDCGERYSWWNSVPQKGFKLADDYIPFDPDVDAEPPVETGQVEKVVPVKRVLLHYAIEGNYYLLPEDGFAEQYGALRATLDKQAWAILTYLQPHTKTRRYAIMSEGGVLMALELADKKAIPSLDYDTSEAMEQQAEQMLESMVEDDPALEDVEADGIKQIVKERAQEAESDTEPDAIAKEV